jgi:hypothetical protein
VSRKATPHSTRNRRNSINSVGWKTVFAAIDDHAKNLNEERAKKVPLLRSAVACFACLEPMDSYC